MCVLPSLAFIITAQLAHSKAHHSSPPSPPPPPPPHPLTATASQLKLATRQQHTSSLRVYTAAARCGESQLEFIVQRNGFEVMVANAEVELWRQQSLKNVVLEALKRKE